MYYITSLAKFGNSFEVWGPKIYQSKNKFLGNLVGGGGGGGGVNLAIWRFSNQYSSSVLCFIFGSVLFGFSHYLMAGNFRRRKLSQNSQFCGYLESFLHEIWGRSFGSTSEQSVNVFSAKKIFSPVRESFLPRKFPAIYSI